MQYQSVKETAKRFKISERRVQKLCKTGRIKGAKMISGVWVIPEDAQKPNDKRTAYSGDDMISLNELCKELSVSIATGRNWVKLGKIIPSDIINKTPYFTPQYVRELKESIQNGDNSALKSRRNKKYISGNSVYNSYLPADSENLHTVKNIIEYINIYNIEIDEIIIRSLISECAMQLFASKSGNIRMCGNLLRQYLNNNIDLDGYGFLIDEFIREKQEMLDVINNYPKLFSFEFSYKKGEDVLGLLYISLKNIGARKADGSYYTPAKIVKKLCYNLFKRNDFKGKRVFDPCCGTGNFLLQLPDEIGFDCIYGNDIDSVSVKIARINMALRYGIADKSVLYSHITQADYLNTDFNKQSYDFIIGNPPWGYDYSESEKKRLRQRYSSAVGSGIESYDVFIEKAVSDLSLNGVLSFVLPEAVLNVKTHLPVRKILMQSNSFQYLEFLGNAFDKVQCPCIILQVLHNGKPFSSIGMAVSDGEKDYMIVHERPVENGCFNFRATDEEHALLNKISNIPNKVTLEGNAIFALGIVTGNNKEYISHKKNDGNEVILKGSDIYKYRLGKADNYITFKPENFQQTAPEEYYRAPEKLLYRFICNQLVFAYDDKQTLSLNSCNILIPLSEGLNIKYIMAVLNSKVAQFYFKKQFNSVKVLRSHIEQIPIPKVAKEVQSEIIRMAENLIAASQSSDIYFMYEALDKKIAKLFNLSDDEYAEITAAISKEKLFL